MKVWPALEQFGLLLSHPPSCQRSCHSLKNSRYQDNLSALQEKPTLTVSLTTVPGSRGKSLSHTSSSSASLEVLPFSLLNSTLFLPSQVRRGKIDPPNIVNNKMYGASCSVYLFSQVLIKFSSQELICPVPRSDLHVLLGMHYSCLQLFLLEPFPLESHEHNQAPDVPPQFLPTCSLKITISVCIFKKNDWVKGKGKHLF